LVSHCTGLPHCVYTHKCIAKDFEKEIPTEYLGVREIKSDSRLKKVIAVYKLL
jgi:hypothetical protein